MDKYENLRSYGVRVHVSRDPARANRQSQLGDDRVLRTGVSKLLLKPPALPEDICQESQIESYEVCNFIF